MSLMIRSFGYANLTPPNILRWYQLTPYNSLLELTGLYTLNKCDSGAFYFPISQPILSSKIKLQPLRHLK